MVNDWKNPGEKAQGYAVLEDEGVGGEFNRSGRAAMNFLEYVPLLVGFVVLAGVVFPFPVFVLCVCQVIGRVICSIGYTSAAGGRMPGFLLSNLGMGVLEMMVLFIGLRSLDLFPFV